MVWGILLIARLRLCSFYAERCLASDPSGKSNTRIAAQIPPHDGLPLSPRRRWSGVQGLPIYVIFECCVIVFSVLFSWSRPVIQFPSSTNATSGFSTYRTNMAMENSHESRTLPFSEQNGYKDRSSIYSQQVPIQIHLIILLPRSWI